MAGSSADWDGVFNLEHFSRFTPRGSGASPNHYVFELEYKLSNGVLVWTMMKHYRQDRGRTEYSFVKDNRLSDPVPTVDALSNDGAFLRALADDPLRATLLVQDFLDCLRDVEATARPVLRSLALGEGTGRDVSDLEHELRVKYDNGRWIG